MIIIKKLFTNKAFTIELIGFVILQIFIDMYRIFFESRYQIFGIALPELINFAYFFALTVVFIANNYKKPKRLIAIGAYTAIVFIYLIFHIANALKLDQGILNGSELNWFKEIYFIIRTYLIPVYIFFYFICSDLTLDLFKKAISIISLIISTNIIITNIFKVSFICYASALEKNAFITRNVFEWFYNPDTLDPSFMASKGWFYMGNQIGLILLMLLPFAVMIAFESGKVHDYLIAFANAFALIFVGTKVATLGSLIVLLAGFAFAILFGLILKQFRFQLKHMILYCLAIILCLGVLPVSPLAALQGEREIAQSESEEQQTIQKEFVESFENLKPQEDGETDESKKELSKKELEIFKKNFSAYVNSSPYFFGIDPEFLDLFPVEKNFDFWYDIVIHGNNKQADYRYFKSVLYNEILDLNENELQDNILGIGYISNFPYSEQDFVSQTIWFGFVGTILLIYPYFVFIVYGIFLALKKYKTCFHYRNAFFAVSICLATALAIMAGHLFYGIFSITIFAFISASFTKYQTERHCAE